MTKLAYLYDCIVCGEIASRFVSRGSLPLCSRIECYESWTLTAIKEILAQANQFSTHEQLNLIRSYIKRLERATESSYDPDWSFPEEKEQEENIQELSPEIKYKTSLTVLKLVRKLEQSLK